MYEQRYGKRDLDVFLMPNFNGRVQRNVMPKFKLKRSIKIAKSLISIYMERNYGKKSGRFFFLWLIKKRLPEKLRSEMPRVNLSNDANYPRVSRGQVARGCGKSMRLNPRFCPKLWPYLL